MLGCDNKNKCTGHWHLGLSRLFLLPELNFYRRLPQIHSICDLDAFSENGWQIILRFALFIIMVYVKQLKLNQVVRKVRGTS